MPRRPRSPAKALSLAEYRRKRDFGRTAEPRGNGGTARARGQDSGRYVIQKHHASREHFDLRLELDGVMKSWAVPKGPSRDPSEKRLAVQVEDHPIEYNTFEGIIPEGEYGAGTVMIWDRGRHVPEGGIDAMRRGLEEGKISFRLDGERLEGGWTLIRMHGRGRDGRQWLLVKQKDGLEVAGDDLVEQDVPSVASARRMTEIAAGKRAARPRASPKESRRGRAARKPSKAAPPGSNGAGRRGMPTLTPMLATIGTELPDDAGEAWAFEPKYDGVRVLAFVTRDSVALVTRNGREKAAQFPEIVEALESLHARRRRPFVIDGEIVARSGRGLGRFQGLQRRIGEQDPETIQQHMKTAPVVLVAFDLLLDGEHSLLQEPWTARRTRLERLLAGKLPRGLRLGQARVGNGARLLARARELGWEGLIAKRADAPYLPGQRSADWRKLKVEMRQEFVVGGWTDPRRTRPHLGALLLGYWEGNRLRYAGHMGGGFTRQALEEMRERLEPLAQPQSPFDEEPDTNEPAHWVRPEVVVEVKFNEWTADGRLRQPIFVGVRDDRNPRTVVREAISMQDDDRDNGTKDGRRVSAEGNGHAVATGSRRGRGRIRKRVHGMKDLDGVFDALLEIEEAGGDGTIEFGRGNELAVSSLDKFYFRDAQRTKGDLMRYYVRAAPWLLPLMADRPLALKRHPEGVEGESFFQQAPPENTPPGVRVERVPTEDGPAPRVIGGDLITLLYCVQLGSIAVNPWHSRVRTLETPDYSVIDLDPGPRAPFVTVIRVARWLHGELEDAGISAAAKTSGSRGLHIVIPLPSGASAESAQLMAELFSKRVAEAHRKEATTIRSKSQRSQRAVYIDYMQNVVGKTVVAALSVRAKPGATVSTPLAWEELTDDLEPTVFTIDTVPDELEARGRMFLDVLQRGNRLERLLASA